MEITEDLIRAIVRMARESNSAITHFSAGDDENKPTAAVVVLHGEDTGRILAAIKAEADRIEAEAEAEAETEA